ncbi:helix-turn-helix domain-containing protein [Streptomonospora nanhaiensis]|uniref:helix-turn-helix domain-containing protein n=1 Tax=Streptomonospora nanhaiensis TaxID=1323731 RepID=UPI001C387D1F|nr:XRE family transcriptional regulator [Streptomonospora nanhaiensis]MBV2365761.1 XRE family transcriptional regulator [Streptomonospora nanhaiensis]MBX9388092.1 XRE family transcriptional regulator [Streptomonospora nanhaiensis]
MQTNESGGVPGEGVDALLGTVGPRLREVRTRRRLKLADVAERTGLSVSTLSRLESGLRRPSLDVLIPLARLYRVPLDELVGAPATGDPRIHPRPVRRDGMIYIPLAGHGAPVQAFKLILPGRDPGAPIRQSVHGGYEWLYVLTGPLHLKLGADTTVLDGGEAAEFDTRRPHGIASGSDRPAEILILFSPQGEQIHIRDAGGAEGEAGAAAPPEP